MIQIITDSIYFYKKNPDFIFAQELFRWEINHNNKYSLLTKKILNKKHINLLEEELIGIVSPSNYKLQFDLKELNIKKIYIPEFYKNAKSYKIDYKKIDELFDKFLKRSYLSFLNYEKLRNIGLNRIEQFLLLGNILATSNFKNYDNLNINEALTIKKIEEVKTEEISQNKIKLIDFVKTISLKKNINFDESTKIILQEYGLLNISDPFLEEGFILLRNFEDKTIFNLGVRILKNKIKINIFKLYCLTDNKKEKIIYIKKAENKLDDDLINYYNIQKEDYFEDKRIIPLKELDNLNLIYQSTNNILPLKDFILTLKSLIKLNKTKNINAFFSLSEENKKKLNIKKNIKWLSSETWNNIYNERNYTFNNIIEEINTDDISFVCPLCGNKETNITPLRFFCKERSCNFIFDRTTLDIVEVNSIQEEKMIEALNNKKIFIKNKNGKNFIAYLKNNDNYYFLSLKE